MSRTTQTRFIYLHGFASSPDSTKGRWLAQRLAEHGHELHIPDLNLPDFAHLTLTAMIDATCALVCAQPDQPVALIGSSLGGQVALHVADRLPQHVQAAILLAPALDFAANRRRQMSSAELDSWATSGWHSFYNYRDSAELPVHYGLLADAERYRPDGLECPQPTLIIHGKHDASVPYTASVAFAQQRAAVSLVLLEADHGMVDQMEIIWALLAAFCRIR